MELKIWIINIEIIITLLMIFYLVIYQRILKKNKFLFFMFIFMFLAFICIYLVNSTDDQLINFNFTLFALIFFNLSLYFIYLHYESLENTIPSKFQNAIILGLIGANITLCLYLLGDGVILQHILFIPVVTTIVLLYVTFISGYFLQKSYKITKNKQFKNARNVWIFSFPIIVTLIYYMLIYSGLSLSEFFHEMGYIIVTFALLFCSYHIIFFPTITSSPYPIYFILIYNEEATPIYKKKVSQFSKITKPIAWNLIAGLFSAISTFIQEISGKPWELKTLRINLYDVFFCKIFKEHTIALIGMKDNLFVRHTIKGFIQEVDKHINELNIPENHIDNNIREVDRLVQKFFSIRE